MMSCGVGGGTYTNGAVGGDNFFKIKGTKFTHSNSVKACTLSESHSLERRAQDSCATRILIVIRYLHVPIIR